MVVLDRLLGRRPRKRKNGDDPIVRYELYEKVPGGEWKLMRYLPEAIDFNQVEDAMPGCSYRLYARRKSGKFGVLWFEHLEGPGIVQGRTSTSFAEMEASLEMMIRFGEMIEGLKGNIRAAFGWVFPEKQQSGGWIWTEKDRWIKQPPPSQPRGGMVGDVMRSWLTVMESAVDSANRMGLARCVRLLVAQREAEAAEKAEAKPQQSPDDRVS